MIHQNNSQSQIITTTTTTQHQPQQPPYTTLDNYILFLNHTCDKSMKLLQEKNVFQKHKKEKGTEKKEKKVKINEKEKEKEKEINEKEPTVIIPDFYSYSSLIYNKHNIQDLKTIAKTYKLKVSGNKNDLLLRIYTFLKLSSHVVYIQKMYRGHLQRKYNKYHGPAFIKREICTNPNDFLTIEDVKDLPFSQFFSYTDTDGFTYGFDIVSLHNLIVKSNQKAKNPYNRNSIPEEVVQNIHNLIRLSKLLKIDMELEIHDIQNDISHKKSMELRILDIFQNIDALGNYSSPSWFLSLNRTNILKFMRELIDIWNYRAQLSHETKRNICPPHGDPFRNINLNYLNQELMLPNLYKIVVPVLEKIISTGIDHDSKSLGAYYILGALTLVNDNAATALPWLFQSVSYF